MALDGVPWFTGGGAEHSPAIARMLAYITLQGCEGVVDPLDCRALSMPVPSNRIRVMPGAFSVLNRAAGGDRQTYLGRVTSQEEIATTPTGSSGPRSDLVIIRVENPHESGETWPMPANIANGPYVFVRIIEGVPGNTFNVKGLNLGYSAIAIARIDIPASTSAITQAMIKDLRSIAKPGGERLDEATPGNPDGQVVIPGTPSTAPLNATDNTAMVNWPAQAGNIQIPIPANATSMDYTVKYNNIINNVDTILGHFQLGTVDGLLNSPLGKFVASTFNIGTQRRTNQEVKGTMAIPAALRGKKVSFKLLAKSTTVGNGRLDIDDLSYITVNYTFKTNPALS